MTKFRTLFLRTAFIAGIFPFGANAVPVFDVSVFTGMVPPNDVATNEAFVDANTPDITFNTSTVFTIDNGSGGNTGGTIFGLVSGFATNYTGSMTTDFTNSLFLIEGFVDLTPGLHNFFRSTNDGFSLTIGGTSVLSGNTQGISATSASFAGGTESFRLVYWNNANVGRLIFNIDDEPAAAAPSNVSSPATLPLLLAAFGVLGLARVRHNSRVA